MYHDVIDALRSNFVVFTDIFNSKAPIPPLNLAEFNKFNYIIQSDDVVNINIFSSMFNHINKIDGNMHAVYVNPPNVIHKTATVFTKPANPNINIPLAITKDSFYFPLNPLRVYDNLNAPHRVLSIATIPEVQYDKIWQLNPNLTLDQNMDILMQKLLFTTIMIDSDTYNELHGKIEAYNSFKIINVVMGMMDPAIGPSRCNFTDLDKYTPLGFDFTIIPN
ncbi:hypothetical protein PmNV_054 [Penaeus monodon nudivirus]|uniref:Uncharacterized protein n=2 Tax=Lefavirales TaxID=2840070 RepID=A0A076FCA0_9VIRU|nr:hypothetical protein PmNV_054 [Penaeus monodon nudivirus]AII15842.1 hypothetical protein PmNV_054 [Penaeus monodon nudivirus]